MSTLEVSASIGALILKVAGARGADVGRLLAETGFDATSALDPDRYIPLELETRLWDRAAELVGDEAFGMHAAEAVAPGMFGVLDYVVRTAPTLREALERLARYNRIVHDAAVFRITDTRERTRVEHDLGGVVQSRHAAEVTIGSLLVIGRQMAGADVSPLAAEFRHARPRPGVVAEHRRFLGVEPAYGAPVNALEFDRALLARPTLSADPQLSRVIERHAEALLAARPEALESIAHRVRRHLVAALRDAPAAATLGTIAAKLHSSERSLQRRLADAGVTFDALLDDTRRELALRYLSDDKIAIAEIAYLLGYSEPSAFHRAFKRWTGKTPAQARSRAA